MGNDPLLTRRLGHCGFKRFALLGVLLALLLAASVLAPSPQPLIADGDDPKIGTGG
ncbi:MULTISPECIES: hypothetical protein [unclassified Meiothermus]|uniref:hypothetical protein n=1 Tax=unclassified Meiothermus TaxID=370471 RepID=UPI001314B52F|nr:MULTISPECIES: hypothetical protein [unclassified Meiothermus]